MPLESMARINLTLDLTSLLVNFYLEDILLISYNCLQFVSILLKCLQLQEVTDVFEHCDFVPFKKIHSNKPKESIQAVKFPHSSVSTGFDINF